MSCRTDSRKNVDALCLIEQTQERAHIPSKTNNKPILSMQLFQNSKDADHPFGLILNPSLWTLKSQRIFCLDRKGCH